MSRNYLVKQGIKGWGRDKITCIWPGKVYMNIIEETSIGIYIIIKLIWCKRGKNSEKNTEGRIV